MGTKRRKPAVEPAHIAQWIKKLPSAEAVDALCRAYEPLAVSLAAGYYQDDIGTEREDLEQTARMGLIEACQTFDAKKGAAFSTHATWRIRGALSAYVQRLENPTRLPTWLMHTLPKLRKQMQAMANELGREPSSVEVAERMKLKPAAVEAMLAYMSGPVEITDTVDDDRLTPEEIMVRKGERWR